MKKVASLVGAGAMLLVMAVPTFACHGHMCWWGWFNDTAVVRNVATVVNDVTTVADTGDNTIGGWFGRVVGSDIDTGNAMAGSAVTNTVNSNAIDCDCYDDLTLTNNGWVMNDVTTVADTGDNKIGGWWTSRSDLDTGNAEAMAVISNVVNTNLFGN